MTAFTHVTVGTDDIDRIRTFYDKVLATLGWIRVADLHDGSSIWGDDKPSFFVLTPTHGRRASDGTSIIASFAAPSRAAVTAFHAAAVAAGISLEGIVGPHHWAPDTFAAYMQDPDGNRLAVYAFTAE